MRITADDVEPYLLAAKAKEEKTFGDTVNEDVERVGRCYRTAEGAVGDAACE